MLLAFLNLGLKHCHHYLVFFFFLSIGFASFTGSMLYQYRDASGSRSYVLFGASPWKQMSSFASVFSANVLLLLIVVIGSHDNPVYQSLWLQSVMCRLALLPQSALELGEEVNLRTLNCKLGRDRCQTENRQFLEEEENGC